MVLVWHRADLRLHDLPALLEALKRGPALGLVVLDPLLLKTHPRRRAWFFANLRALRLAYAQRGGLLLIREGPPWEVVPWVARAVGAEAVHASLAYTPYGRMRDERVGRAVPLKLFPGQYAFSPEALPFRPSFRAFERALGPLPPPLEAPLRFPPVSLDLPLGEVPQEIFPDLPEPGERAALRALERFLSGPVHRYLLVRDALEARTSRLSPYFTLGVLSPRLALSRALALEGEGPRKWASELVWREYSAHLLYHRPEMLHTPLDPRFARFPWREDEEGFQAFLEGRTGVPVVDAAMRELRATGFVSNRARMLVAQYAVKYALLPWKRCEEAFRHLLLDGDTANNLQGWQWAGGLGVDRAPYFRMFNLVKQGYLHDPGLAWLRRWAPEYPGYEPVGVDLEGMRRRYLDLVQGLKGGGA
ncbi:MAG: deoxyribodipyrimidine photo-lyase [Thermus sp.]|uniref:cryptochrome/photolyase family protein n=1 Tax=Thermus sp. TaxID=275 RepID=UPI003326F33E